jgi:hypothetical protein
VGEVASGHGRAVARTESGEQADQVPDLQRHRRGQTAPSRLDASLSGV